ncbi:MAG: EamA family transporter [Bacteroidetes bacterium]|nr:EamA family transporter [Bacteroidota bacterium]
MKNKTLQAHLALIIVNIIYAANFSIAKEVMPAFVQPFAFVLMRVGGALSLFWIVGTFFIKEKVDKKDLPRMALLAVFGVALNQLLFLKGLSLTKPINGAIIMTSNPIIVMIIAAVFLKEKISFQKIAGILIGIVGALIMLLYGKDFALGSDTLFGDMLILINSVSWAMYVVLVKPLMQKYNTFTVVKWVFLFGFLYVLPFGFNEFQSIQWETFTPHIWKDVLFVVLATTFFAYILNTYALRALSPSVVSIYIYLQPFLASLIAIVYYKNDELDLRKLTAGVLIIFGVYLVSMPFKKSLPKSKELPE